MDLRWGTTMATLLSTSQKCQLTRQPASGSNLFNLDNNNWNELLEKDNLVTGCLTNK